MGVAEIVNWFEIDEENLLDAIEKVLREPSYTKNAQTFGTLLTDEINKPLDRTVWHIEHLIRNPNIIDHMRSPVHNLTWYQYYSLDVIAFLTSLLLLLLLLIFKLTRSCCCSRSSNNRGTEFKKKQK